MPEPTVGIQMAENGFPSQLSKQVINSGEGVDFLETLLFNAFKSTQIRIAPDFFGTGTIPEHQGVGTSTLDIILLDSIFLSSILTASLSSRSGTFRAVYKALGLASGLSCMV